MTRRHIEDIARSLGEDRYSIWTRKCGTHHWSRLPLTADTGEHSCVQCGTLFSTSGATLNQPQRVHELVSQRSHLQGRVVAKVHRGREARHDIFTYQFFGTGVALNVFITLRSSTKEEAQAKVDARLAADGHHCSSEQCGAWTFVN